MGKCRYCGESAGFLRNKHKACEQKYIKGKSGIYNLVLQAITTSADFSDVNPQAERVASETFVGSEEAQDLYLTAFENAVEQFLDDGILSKAEEHKVASFQDAFGFSQQELDRNGAFNRVINASIIRDITEGNLPENPIHVEGALPFNLLKSESLIWLFQDVEFMEQTTRREFQGGHQGVSIRVAKGLYYRTGSFKGRPVHVQEMKYIDTGLMGITNKHVYFSSASKNFRVRLNRIMKTEPYEDGIGLQKDTANAKPQVYKGLDGWFVYNLIQNLMQL